MYRHEFYETDDKVTISVFDKGADPTEVEVKFEPRKVRPISLPRRLHTNTDVALVHTWRQATNFGTPQGPNQS
jgi:hypothetical protein